MKLITAACFVFALSATALAGSITGVINSAEGRPLPGATVVTGDGQVTAADENGRFVFTNVTPPVMVSVSHVGYTTLRDIELSGEGVHQLEMSPVLTMLNSLVVTGNRYEKEAYKVSQPISVASAEDIERRGHTIVSDVIREFPGLDMNDAGPFRARPVVRGLYGTRVLVLVDGERLNDQRDVVDFAGASMSLVDVNEIERVEVINGPASVLYGSDAMAGVINIITRQNGFNSELTPYARYSGRYSTVDRQHSNRFDLGLQAERVTFSLGTQYREANKDYRLPDEAWTRDERYGVFRPGFYDTLNAEQGTDFGPSRLANSQARINNYDARLAYKFNGHHRVDLDFGAFRASDIGYPGVPNDSTPFWFFYPNHDRDNFSVTYTATSLSDKLVKLEGKLYYEKISKDFLTDFLGQLKVEFGPPFDLSSVNPLRSLNHTEVTKIGLNFQELYKLSDRATMTFGIDSWRETIEGQSESATEFSGSAFGLGPGETMITTETNSPVPDNKWHALGVYASGEYNLREVLVNVGLRLDNFWISTDETEGYVDDDGNRLPTADETYTAVNGSLGLVHPVGRGVNAVANVGTAFRVPNVVERFYHGSASHRETRPNPDIRPERSVSVDLGIKAVHENINYSMIGFWSDYNDFTQLQNYETLPPAYPGDSPTPLWRYENVNDVTIYGFESVIEGQFNNGLYGSFSFSYQHGQNNTEDFPLFVSPVKTVTSLGYRHDRHGLFGEVSVRRVAGQDRVPETTALDDIPTEPFTVVNAAAGLKLFERIRLSVSVNNIFDEVYSEPFNGRNPDNPIPEPGRNFVIGLSSSI